MADAPGVLPERTDPGGRGAPSTRGRDPPAPRGKAAKTHDLIERPRHTKTAVTGHVRGQIRRRHRAIACRAFLTALDVQGPADRDVHVIMDTDGTHKPVVRPPHADDRAHPREAVEPHRDERPVAPAGERARVDRLTGRTWLTTSQSPSVRRAARCCLTVGADPGWVRM